MNGEYTVFLPCQNLYVSLAIFTHRHDLTGTLVVHQVSRNDVAVSTGLQASKESLLQVKVVTIDRDKSVISAAEGDLVLAIVPPSVDAGFIRGISETQHIVNLTPSMLADPAVATGIIRIDDRRQSVSGGVVRRTAVEIVEVEGAHNTRIPVRMRQHESDGHLQYDRSYYCTRIIITKLSFLILFYF